MVESIFVRVQNILAAGADTAASAAERASGTSLMREAIRQVERAEDETRDGLQAAKARQFHAERQQQALREQMATLDEQARFALGKERPDLAEAAIARHLDCEKQAKQLEGVAREAGEEMLRLDECLAALKVRKAQMQKELAAFEAVRRQAAAADGALPGDRLERKVARAETLFERAMAAAGGTDVGLMPAGDAAKLAEVEELRKEATIAERLAELRARLDTPPPARGRKAR